MMKVFRSAVLALALAAAWLTQARAQFPDQGTLVSGAAGTANAQTGTVTNASSYSDLSGVLLKLVPAASNTGDATLQINSYASPPHFRINGAALVGGEVVTGRPLLVMYDGTYFQIMGGALWSGSVAAVNLGVSSLNFGMATNLQIAASVASNQLTVTFNGLNGAALSASNPALITFKSQTQANFGFGIVGTITSSPSMTLQTTSSLGCTTAVACRLWITALCQTETGTSGSTPGTCTSVLVGLSAQTNGTAAGGCLPLQENTLQSTGSGTTGGTAQGTIFTSVASLTSKAVRIVGYLEATWTSGTGWGTPNIVQLFGPGIHKPCDLVQGPIYSTTSTATNVTSSTKTATNSTISITPTSAINLVEVMAFGALGGPGNAQFPGFAQISRGSGPTLVGSLGIVAANTSGNDPAFIAPTTLYALDTPATTSSTTYTVYLWGQGTATQYSWLNEGINGTTPVIGVMKAWEIMGALEPANDDVPLVEKKVA
jgi:hypothetical protein